MILKKVEHIILILVFIFILSSCSDTETLKLINTSITTGELLSQYYDNLIKYSIEAWELEAFNSSIRGIDFPVETQKEYQKTISHLEERKRMVESFVKIFPLLEDFVKNRSQEDFKEALTDFGNNINDLSPLQDNRIVVPSTIFGNLAEDIINLFKFFEIRAICKTVVKSLEKIEDLFDKEIKLYSSIIKDRNNKSFTVVNYMIDNELVIPWALIESAPATVNLDIAVARKPAKDKKNKEALKKVLEVKYFRLEYLIRSTENDIKTLILDLIKTYNEFIEGKQTVFDNLVYITKRIGGHFNDINEYMDYYRNRNTISPEIEIIYHGNTESKIFHHPNCPYYFSKHSNVIFHTREEAVNAGYSPCKTCNP